MVVNWWGPSLADEILAARFGSSEKMEVLFRNPSVRDPIIWALIKRTPKEMGLQLTETAILRIAGPDEGWT